MLLLFCSVVGSPLTDYIDPLRFYHCLNSGMEVISLTGIPWLAISATSFIASEILLKLGPWFVGSLEGTIARRNSGSTASLYNWKNRAIKLLDIVSSEASDAEGLPA